MTMKAEVPSPGAPGHWITRTAPPDAWPAATSSPELARVRTDSVVTPARLFELLHAIHFRGLEALAPNTQRAYDSDWRGFVRFCGYAGFKALPATPPAIEAFIEYSAPYQAHVPYKYLLPEAPRRNCRASTLERAIAAISAVHEWLQHPNPTNHPDVAHTRRINMRRRSARTPKAALPYSAIERALPTYGHGLADLRAKALVTLAFSTMLRRSELVALEVVDFKPTADANDGTVRVRSSKADQAGHGAERYVSSEARRHLEAWLDAAGIQGGAVFVRLNRNGKPLSKALHPNQVALIVKDLARRAGFGKREIKSIAAHSTRIGATHALAEAGADVLQVQQDGGWKSPHMPATYLRGQKARSGGMAQWFRARDSRPAR
jgi:site-specific recombinase XerD